MAQFITQGRLKLLFNNGEGVSFGLEPKDPFHYNKLRSVQTHLRRLRFLGFTTTRFFFSSSSSSSYVNNKSSSTFNLEACLRVSDSEGVYDDDDDNDFDHNDELERDDLSCFRGLVLDISYRPVNVVCWKRAICLEFMEKADVLEYYDQTVNSPSGSFYIPAVLRVPHLLQVVKRRRIKNHLSRKNILYRDNYTCQYCSSQENLTIDHVLPAARGGEWKWENLAPKDYDILAIPLTTAALKMLKTRKGTPEEWRQYLSKLS
ncbi:uncharacterized protein LOC126693034 isoform X2 [Quercus robur]|uniref:uncharacterized protein LOC126693034 isoform X2 n=1 Tax=Quercus robur TaxID=38942 RepID=UPI002163BE24|nr:uncharacterized protein LOC126693034 isoform X2 [Quercus robur]